jgi:hypothetical protein
MSIETLVPDKLRKKIDHFLLLCNSKIRAEKDANEVLSEVLYISMSLDPDKRLDATKVLNVWAKSYNNALRNEREKFEALTKALAGIFHQNEMLKGGKFEDLSEVLDVEYVPRKEVDSLISRHDCYEITGWTQQNFYHHEKKGNLVPYNWRGEKVESSYRDTKFYSKTDFDKLLKRTRNGQRKPYKKSKKSNA